MHATHARNAHTHARTCTKVESRRGLKKNAIGDETARKIKLKLQAALYGTTAAKFFAKYRHVMDMRIYKH